VTRTRANRIYAATIGGLAFWLAATSALAQSSTAYRQYCQTVSGRVVCGPASGAASQAGARPYERWDNGSPARDSGSPSAYPSHGASAFPQGLGAYGNLGTFGR
jgi:hypothetical protein